MNALDKVLESFRHLFGVKSETANEVHKLACEELAALRAERDALKYAIRNAYTALDDDYIEAAQLVLQTAISEYPFTALKGEK